MSTLPFLRRRRPRARHIHRGARRRLLVWLAAVPVLVLVALVASAVIDNALHRGRVLRNVSVAGADISGTRDAPLRARLEALVPDVAALPVELRSGDQVVNTTASAAGLRMDVEATAAAARHTGRGGITSPFSWIAGFFSDRTAPLRLAVDEPTLAGALAPFGSAGQDQLRFEVRDGKIVATVGQPGMRVDAAAAADALRRSAARGDKPLRAAVRATRAEP
jgi:hypothetical protein